MIRQALLIPAMIFGLLFTNSAVASDDDRNAGRRAFVGLWQAIDSFDGSTQRLSITCASRKSCDVRLNDTSFGLSCPNPPQTGFASGEGAIRKGVLTVVLTLACRGSTANSDELPSQSNTFEFDRKNGILTNFNSDLEFSNPPPLARPNVFHKISR